MSKPVAPADLPAEERPRFGSKVSAEYPNKAAEEAIEPSGTKHPSTQFAAPAEERETPVEQHESRSPDGDGQGYRMAIPRLNSENSSQELTPQQAGVHARHVPASPAFPPFAVGTQSAAGSEPADSQPALPAEDRAVTAPQEPLRTYKARHRYNRACRHCQLSAAKHLCPIELEALTHAIEALREELKTLKATKKEI